MNVVPGIGNIRTQADPLDVLEARAWARAHLYAAGELHSLHEAVDPLQRWAVDSGLVERIGQDAVQQILVHAFARVQRSFATDCEYADVAVAAAQQCPCERHGSPKSTRDAAVYLAGTNASQLEAWLLGHSPAQQAVIVSYLREKQDRS
jgi:hypothetical protein